MRRLASLASLLVLLLPAVAAAQDAEPSPSGAQADPPEAQAAAGRLHLRVDSGIEDGGTRYAMRGQVIEVRGVVSPYRLAQYATVEVVHAGDRVLRERVLIRRAGDEGRFVVRFTARRTGRYIVRAEHEATPQLDGLTADPQSVTVIEPRARGLGLRLLQRGLASLGYVTSRNGRFDAATARAVLAFRKVNSMARNTSPSQAVFRKVFRGAGGFELRYPREGKHVEFDWSRQVLVLADDGRAQRIYHASSGKPSTPTVFGHYRFYRKQPGTNSHGMVHSNYFIGGYAIHGYRSVPNFPASHGCIRVPIPNARAIDRWIRLGDDIFVYR